MPEWLKITLSHPDTPVAGLAIALKTAIVYIALVVGLRLMGKRELGQMTIYDLVLIIVLANAVQNSMIGEDSTLFGGVIAAITLLVMNRLFSLIMARSTKIERFMVGEPLLIVHDGKIVSEKCKIEGVTHEQIMAALREHGLEKLSQVHLAVLEVDGTISVVPTDSVVHKTKHHFKALRLP